MQCVDWL